MHPDRNRYLRQIKDKIITRNNINRLAGEWKSSGRKIVFTNGCFDILHRGHVEYLSLAAGLGDRLIIGLNSDSSVKRQGKGPGRPVNDEQSRAIMLASLGFTDAVVLFEEDTPAALIGEIQPDILVKGGDYHPDQIAGADVVKAGGGQVLTIPLVDGFSTTEIIRKLQGDG